MAETTTGGRAIVDTLLALGTERVFCVPGESFLGVLDALRDVQDRIATVVGRHEGSTAIMAEATAKLTGRPGICFVTRGPGASHAAIALHVARQDSTPLILFIGQADRDQLGREAFQEIDFTHMFGKTAKWVVEIDDARRIPELITRAFNVATSGRPGPVVVSIPEDMQRDPSTKVTLAPMTTPEPAPSLREVERLSALVEEARRPMLVVGGSRWGQAAIDDIGRFSEAHGIPVVAGFRRQDLFDNLHQNYAGYLGFGAAKTLHQHISTSDLLIVVGERLGDVSTASYALIDFPVPAQKIIHVHAGPEELGQLYQPALAINASPSAFAEVLATLDVPGLVVEPGWAERCHADFITHTTPPVQVPGMIDVPGLVAQLSQTLPAGTVISNGAGVYAGYVHRFFRFRHYGTQLATTSGSMGYGLPAAIAAALQHPDRLSICFAGDGCYLMAGHELATAVEHQVKLVIIVVDNGSYGSIRAHQERQFPGRKFATDLNNPDFAALARSFGAYGEPVERTEDFDAAFQRAVAVNGPALLHLKLNIDDVLKNNPRNS